MAMSPASRRTALTVLAAAGGVITAYLALRLVMGVVVKIADSPNPTPGVVAALLALTLLTLATYAAACYAAARWNGGRR